MIFLIVFFAVKINQISNTAATTNTISFNGEGKVLAKPDIAVLDLSIITEATTSKAAQDDNSKKSKEVTDFLKKQDISEKDIKTTGYNILPQYNYPRFDKPEIRGYQVSQILEIKIRNLDKTSEILDGVVSAGANQVNDLSFQIEKPDELKTEAREKAIKSAKTKAEELEKQLGVHLGKIVNYSEGGYSPVYFKTEALDSRGGIGGGGPEVPVGENEIVVSVTITYQIK